MEGPIVMKRYLCLAALAVGAAVTSSGAGTAGPTKNTLEVPQIVYRGTLIDGTTGKAAKIGDKYVTKKMVFAAYGSEDASAPQLWTSQPLDVSVNPDGSFEVAFGDDALWTHVASGNVTHVGMALCTSANPPKLLPEITPRRALRPLAAVNRALFAEGAAADISIGTLETKNLVANALAVESLEASAGVTGSRAQGVCIGRFTVAKDERTRVVGREIKMFNAPVRVATVNNPVRGQALWKATGNGTVLVHTTAAGPRETLRIPGVVQIVRTGDVVRAPCTEHGGVSVEYYPFAGYKGTEDGK